MPLKRNGSSPHASFRNRNTSSNASRLMRWVSLLVAGSGADMNLLRHLIEPSGLIPTRETHDRAALGQLIEPGDFKREAQRVPSGKDVTNRTDLDPLGVVDHVLGQYREGCPSRCLRCESDVREAHRVETHVLRDSGLSTTSSIIRCQRSGSFAIGRNALRSSIVAGIVGRKKYMNFIARFPAASLGQTPRATSEFALLYKRKRPPPWHGGFVSVRGGNTVWESTVKPRGKYVRSFGTPETAEFGEGSVALCMTW